jgi:hypothetical protein
MISFLTSDQTLKSKTTADFITWIACFHKSAHCIGNFLSRKYESIHPLTYTPSWRSAELVKHRDNFSFCGLNLERKILDTILCEVDSSDIP